MLSSRQTGRDGAMLCLTISWDVITLRMGYIEGSPPAFHELDLAPMPQGLRAFLRTGTSVDLNEKLPPGKLLP
jgi:hypothetical protein